NHSFQIKMQKPGRRGDEDELQGPQADVRDGEEVVVADAVAARLLRVAGEGGLLVPPDALGRHHQHHYPEDEDDGEPDAPDGRGVAVHPAQHRVEAGPVHRLWEPGPGAGQGTVLGMLLCTALCSCWLCLPERAGTRHRSLVSLVPSPCQAVLAGHFPFAFCRQP
uniref:Uncharacterized protein n=1 Tax=Anas platyrhynchos platyrhynchos TaxID=8840 RepID=A0A493TY82_ANAPP